MLNLWKDGIESRGVKVNMNIIKPVLIGGENYKVVWNTEDAMCYFW